MKGIFVILFILQVACTVSAGDFLGNNCTKKIADFEGLNIDSVSGLNWENKEYRKETDDEVIIVKRFSTHLAQVQIFCREMLYAEHGIGEIK